MRTHTHTHGATEFSLSFPHAFSLRYQELPVVSVCNKHTQRGTRQQISDVHSSDITSFLICRYQQVPVVLVGNKVDLEEEREVSPSEGQALAEDWGCPFMETSAKSKTMVDELFAEIVRQMDFCPLPDRRETCCPACSVQ